MTLQTLLQKYVERRTKSAINEQVEERTRYVDLLRSLEQSGIPIFHRREIQCGDLLGQGNFSDVYEVTRFKLKAASGLSQSLEAEDARLNCSLNAKQVLKATGSCKYAIKQPKQPRHREFVGSSRNGGSSEDNSKFQMYIRAAIDVLMEARYLSAFDHPNIIKVRGLSSGANPFIILDRLDETLDKRILRWRHDVQAGKVPADSKALLQKKTDYALQIAEAVKYLHDRRIIVRDLKPSNIGFRTTDNGDEVLQLFDFGLCRELPPQAENNGTSFRMSLAGTLRYMAVEILNTGMYCLKADVYSWSIICFEMMTLEVPFASVCSTPSTHKRFVCREGERPNFPEGPSVPDSLQDLIRNAWAQDANDRLDMATVCAQLKTVMASDIKALPQPIPKKTVPGPQAFALTSVPRSPVAPLNHTTCASMSTLAPISMRQSVISSSSSSVDLSDLLGGRTRMMPRVG